VTLGIRVDMPGGGTRSFVRRVDGIGRRAGDASPAWERIHRSFLAGERARFRSSGAGDWAPLTRQYLSAKTSTGRDPRVMRATGALERALTTGRGPGAVAETTPTAATFGTDLDRAMFAQRGSGRRRRRVLVVTRPRRTRWSRMIRDHLMEGQ
jgi:hypothetical protein